VVTQDRAGSGVDAPLPAVFLKSGINAEKSAHPVACRSIMMILDTSRSEHRQTEQEKMDAPPTNRWADSPSMGSLDVSFGFPALRSFGDLIVATFQAFWRNLGVIAVLVLILMLPGELLKNLVIERWQLHDNLRATMRLDMWVFGLLGALATPAIICAVVQRLRGDRVSITFALKWGARRWGRTIVVRILAGLAILGGTLLLVVPGLIVATYLAVTDAIVAIEGAARPKVLTRSRELVRGHAWPVFGVLLVTYAATFLIAILLSAITAISPLDGFGGRMLGDFVMDTTFHLPVVAQVIVYLSLAGTERRYCGNCGATITDARGTSCPICLAMLRPAQPMSLAASTPALSSPAGPSGLDSTVASGRARFASPQFDPTSVFVAARPHSGIGIASSVLSLLAMAAVVATVIGMVMLVSRYGETEPPESDPLVGISVLTALATVVFAFVGMILGIAGVLQRDRRRVFGVLGLVFNSVMVIASGLLVLMAILSPE
jgi:hypothetical protein